MLHISRNKRKKEEKNTGHIPRVMNQTASAILKVGSLGNAFSILKENYFYPRTLYLGKLSVQTGAV